ncbi:MAG TPA: hypothetical protein VNK52_05105 [Hyphomicrobiaceae bacterium]|nr:hypothetical protein [Hyphomicrobiaceae bacterium]
MSDATGGVMAGPAPGPLITIDRSTVWAAFVTLVFTVGSGVVLSQLPAMSQSLSSVVDALKNIVYVLTIPVFDISRRLFLRRQVQRTHIEPVEGSRNLFFVVFVSALLLFAITEIISYLVGFGVGYLCRGVSAAATHIRVGDCFAFGLNTMSSVVTLPVMLAIGLACGWIWRRLVPRRLLWALAILVPLLLALFTIDYLYAMATMDAEILQPIMDQIRSGGAGLQIGKQVVFLTVPLLLGYGVAAFWGVVARRLG